MFLARRHCLPLRRLAGILLSVALGLVETNSVLVAAPSTAPDTTDSALVIWIDERNREAERIARSDPALAERLANQALESARAAGYERGRIEALHNLGRVARLRGQWQVASSHLTEALSAAETLDDPRLIAKVGNSYGIVLERLGLDAEAQYRHEQVQQAWRRLGDIPGQIASSINLARVFERRQNWVGAEQHYQDALAQYQAFARKDLVPPQDLAAIWMGQGRIALQRGLLDQAERAFRSALDLQTVHRDLIGEAAARIGLARVAAARGEEAVAESGLTQALQLATRVGARTESVEALAELGRWHLARAGKESTVASRRARLQQALEFTQRALDRFEGDHGLHIDLIHQLATIHERLGDPAKATAALETALALSEHWHREQNEARSALLSQVAKLHEREHELAALRAAAERQAEDLAQETLLRRAYAVVMTLLCALLVLLTVRFIESKRAARERAETNSRLANALQIAEQARIRAEEADRIKTEMLGIAAHDLRNPLGSILGFAELIQAERQSSEDVRRHASVIIATAERSLKLINDLLESAALDTGQIQLRPVPCDLSAVLAEAIARVTASARAKQQQIDFRGTSGAIVLADVERLLQVFENLLSNAIKFSYPNGLIEVWIELDEDRVRVAIRDYGPGFSADERKKLFQRFQRLSARPTGGESTTGLGLAIVKDLVTLHEGEVRAESDGPGLGATFWVELKRLRNPPLRLTPAVNETNAAAQRAG